MTDVYLPSTDLAPNQEAFDAGEMFRCVHCLLMPVGKKDVHEILAIAHLGRIPQHAWFNQKFLSKLLRCPDKKLWTGQAIQNWRHWTVTDKLVKLDLSEPSHLGPTRFVWKITDRVDNGFVLGVWAD